MGRIVGVSAVLFVLAVGFVVLSQGPEMATLIGAFRTQPPLNKIAWAVIVLVPLLMLPVAAWLWDRLLRQRRAAGALELRLDGVRTRVKDMGKVQADVEADVHQLTRSDPEDAVAALQRRVTEAERFVEIQQNRNQIGNLEPRVDAIRAQQQALKDRIAPTLDTRRSIERMFAELDSRQTDIDRALAEAASGDDGTALEVRLKNLTEFARQGIARCDQIEHASKTTAALKEASAELVARLAPFVAAEGGITSRVRELGEQRDEIAAVIVSLERTPDGALGDRVQKLADDKRKLEDGISRLHEQFFKLTNLRKDVTGLFAAIDRALNTVSTAKSGDGPTDIDGRIEEVSRFIEQTQTQFDSIEGRAQALSHLKGKLGELQSRLAPLESGETGVAKLIEELETIREKLIVKVRNIEGGEEGDLAARVKTFAETKRELEDRVSSLADQFTKLSSIRKDIAGLFDKLSSAVNASSQ
jgi:predicted  nucleic acid-binding Zn-ribbon protein